VPSDTKVIKMGFTFLVQSVSIKLQGNN